MSRRPLRDTKIVGGQEDLNTSLMEINTWHLLFYSLIWARVSCLNSDGLSLTLLAITDNVIFLLQLHCDHKCTQYNDSNVDQEETGRVYLRHLSCTKDGARNISHRWLK